MTLKWGQKFPVDYPNLIHRMAKRHMPCEFNSYCMTDNPAGLDKDIIPVECTEKWLWDDIDDFDGYTILSFPKHQAFSCSVAVKYVDPSSGFHTSISSPTNYKSVIVKVFHPTISTMIDSMIIGQGL